jgi:FkbM family methyltransferase
LPLTSYAQNFEDVLLWRALGHVSPGFYVDVGAHHPRIDSVSQLFHEHGWRGIHIEPSPQYAALLRAQRSGDEVIEAALSAERGHAVFHEVTDTGLSTLAQTAMELASTRGFKVVDRMVRTMLLDDVLSGIDGPVHWLKIDVEGFEKAVIEGWTNEVRPWVLLIESTQPGSRTEAHEEWEPLVLAKGYQFVWFDGLNRFYVHADHAELSKHLRTPPNVFDAFELSGEATSAFANRLTGRAAELEHLLADSEAERTTLVPHLAQSEIDRSQLESTLAGVEAKHADVIERLRQEHDATQHILAERTSALEAARLAVVLHERDAAVAAALTVQERIAEQDAHARDRENADRARAALEARIEAMGLEHAAAITALDQVVARAVDDYNAVLGQLRTEEDARKLAEAGEAVAMRDAAVAGALLIETRSQIATIKTEAARQRRADQDVVRTLRADHASERSRIEAAHSAIEAVEMERQAVLLESARKVAEAHASEVERQQEKLEQYRVSLLAIAHAEKGALVANDASIQTVIEAVEAIVLEYRDRSTQQSSRAGSGIWARISNSRGSSEQGPFAVKGPLDTAMQQSYGREPKIDRVGQNVAKSSTLRGLRGFWSRDTVADRVDAAVAELEASLDRKLSGMRTIEAAIPGLVSAIEHLTDIGMANIHQTAILQRTLETGVVPAADPTAQEHETERASVAEGIIGQGSNLTAAEQQILENLTRALHASVS